MEIQGVRILRYYSPLKNALVSDKNFNQVLRMAVEPIKTDVLAEG